MISSSRAVVQAGGVLRSVHSEPPVTVRQVFTDDPGACALCLVGSAAGPLGGDRVRLDLALEPGARATLTSAGAVLAQGRSAGSRSALITNVRLDADAGLTAQPQPVVVCAGARVDIGLRIDLDPTAAVRWRELVVLGRSREPGGAATVDWQVRRAGRTVLRQRLDLTADQPWTGLVRGHRVLATELRAGPEVRARTVVRSERSGALRVDDRCELRTVLADDTAAALDELAALDEPAE